MHLFGTHRFSVAAARLSSSRAHLARPLRRDVTAFVWCRQDGATSERPRSQCCKVRKRPSAADVDLRLASKPPLRNMPSVPTQSYT